MKGIKDLSVFTSVSDSCDLLGVPRSSYYSNQNSTDELFANSVKPKQFNGYRISEKSRLDILDVLNNDEFRYLSPYEVYYTLLDRGEFLCSVRSMYRILSEFDNAKFVRIKTRKKVHQKPVLCARNPNEVWSWDITLLKGTERGVYYHLYVMIDIFSRYVVGWMIEKHDNAEFAKHFISSCIRKNNTPNGLTIHSDRGSSMRSMLVVDLLKILGIDKSYSRPRVSNDNPFSESNFSTLKREVNFPIVFESIKSAREYSRNFFKWYNHHHYHSGLNFFSPYSVHFGEADNIYQERVLTIERAKKESDNPHLRKIKIKKHPAEVWINKPIIDNSGGVTGTDAVSIVEVTPPEFEEKKEEKCVF